MVKVILLNDERCSLEDLARALGSRLEVAGNFINLSEAVTKIKEMKADTMSLYDEISERDGLRATYMTVKRPSDSGVIFVFGHTQDNLKCLESDAVNTSKPYGREPGNSERITLWEGQRIVLVNTDKISCCFLQKGQRKVTVVAEKKIYQSNYTLNAFLDKIGKNRLVRCHRSFAINPDYLSDMLPGENNTMVARVVGFNKEIPVSRQYSPRLRTIVGLRTRTDCKNYTALNNV